MHHRLLFLIALSSGELPLFVPVQLVRPNADHSGFEVVADSIARMVQTKKRVAIVSVVGPYHSGKSFLLNALIGRTDVFSVGPKTSPETMGLWLVRTNLTLPTQPEVEVWFIDSEGFFGPQIAESYDAKIFTLALLLADEFVYNTVKIIDSQAVALLEMLARRAQLFRTKSEAHTDQPPGRLTTLPHLTWVVEDFVQASDVSRASALWLDSYLTGDVPYLKKIFPDLSVAPLFLPATSRAALADLSRVPYEQLTAEFRSDLEELRRRILSRLTSKISSPSFSTPSQIGQSVYFLAKALDQGLFPELPSLWNSWRSEVVVSSAEDAFGLFDGVVTEALSLGGSSPPSAASFDTICGSARNNSLSLYTELVQDFASPAEGLELLETRMHDRHRAALSAHRESVRKFLAEQVQAEFSQFMAKAQTAFAADSLVEPDLLLEGLSEMAALGIQKLGNLVSEFDPQNYPNSDLLLLHWDRASFPVYATHPVDELRGELQRQIDAILLENAAAINALISSAAERAAQSVDPQLDADQSKLFTSAQLEQLEESLVGSAQSSFRKQLGRKWLEGMSPQFESAVRHIEMEVRGKLGRFRSAHAARLADLLKKNGEKAINIYRDLKRTLETSLLPCDEQVLVREHDKAVAGLLHALDDELASRQFSDTPEYRHVRDRLNSVVETEFDKLGKKNVELWKVHSDDATQCAYERNLQFVESHCPQGWFCWFRIWPLSHRAKSLEHLLACFEHSKRPGTAPQEEMKNRIFASWYEKEMSREANEVRSNMYIAGLSALVPFLWIVYMRYT